MCYVLGNNAVNTQVSKKGQLVNLILILDGLVFFDTLYTFLTVLTPRLSELSKNKI